MIADRLDLVLASESPRRAALLRGVGLSPRAEPSGVPEAELPGESPEGHVLRLAAAKARSVSARLPAARATTIVLAADTIVVVGDRRLGKPESADDAVRMLLGLSGREHRVVTGVHLERPAVSRSASATSSTTLRFVRFDEALARRYVETGEPAGKAGAYGIQGLGALLVESMRGSWSNVVGLPVECLPGLFREIGWDLWEEVGRSAAPPGSGPTWPRSGSGC